MITPDKAAALFSLIANLATRDIEAEAEFGELVKETMSEVVSFEDVPVYVSCFEEMLYALVNSFLFGARNGEAG